MHDLTKLPKWAQDLLELRNNQIERLEQKVAGLKVELSMAIGKDATRVQIGYDTDSLDGKKFVPDGETIVFYTGRIGSHHEQIQARLEEDYNKDLYLQIMGGTAIAIEPSASNSVRIRIKR